MSLAASSVPATVSTSLTAFDAAQLRLAARARLHRPRALPRAVEPGVRDPDERLDLRRTARVGLGEQRQRLRVDRVQPARRVAERPAERELHRAPEDCGAEPPGRAREVAVRRHSRRRRRSATRRRRRTRRSRTQLEQAGKLRGRMLAVGVDAAAVRVAVLERVAVTGGDAEPEAEVRAERVHLGAVLAGDVGRAVGRTVVDDEDVGVRQLARAARRAPPGGSSSSFQAGMKTRVSLMCGLVTCRARDRGGHRAPTRPHPASARRGRRRRRTRMPGCCTRAGRSSRRARGARARTTTITSRTPRSRSSGRVRVAFSIVDVAVSSAKSSTVGARARDRACDRPRRRR